jgi:isopentenyldiphosphate isomerase
MMKINLLGKPSEPLVTKPADAKKKWSISWCSCGKHPVNSQKDVYKQHNHWMRQQLGAPVEQEQSQLQDATPIGASIKKFEPTYDFSGEDFEMSPEELRKVRDEQEK